MFDFASAIAFNNAAGFPGYLIRAILSAVSGPDDDKWTSSGVTAVYSWQASNGLTADGKVGPKTVGKVLDAMLAGWHFIDAAALKAWWEFKKTAQAAGEVADIVSVVHYFEPTTITPFAFRRRKDKHPVKKSLADFWDVTGTFQVEVRLNPALSDAEMERYEYRQYISGTATLQGGSWVGGVWRAKGPQVKDIGPAIRIPAGPAAPPVKGPIPAKPRTVPKGLTAEMKEDGLVTDTKRTFRFGRRNELQDEDTFRSKWTPDENGPNYVLRDSPGYGDLYIPGDEPWARLNFVFRGDVVEVDRVDTKDGEVTTVKRIVVSKSWAFTFSDKLNWATTPAG